MRDGVDAELDEITRNFRIVRRGRPRRASASWEEHFRFARAASAYKIQHLGNEGSDITELLPTSAGLSGSSLVILLAAGSARKFAGFLEVGQGQGCHGASGRSVGGGS